MWNRSHLFNPPVGWGDVREQAQGLVSTVRAQSLWLSSSKLDSLPRELEAQQAHL